MPSDATEPAPTRWRQAGGWFGVGLVLALLAALLFEFATGRWTVGKLADVVVGWNAVVVFGAMATLPMAGFSVAVLYVVAGMKFGPWGGAAAVAAATAVHLLASHWLGRSFLRARLERLLARHHRHLPHIPPGEDAAVAAMLALVPGLPYFARNYLLALTEVPLRLYFLVCWPIYVVRSLVEIALGDLGAKPGRRALLTLAAVYAVKLAACAYLIWRIRRRLRARTRHARALRPGGPPAAEAGPP